MRAKDVALLSSADGGALIRVIAGEVDGHSGPGTTQTPITLIHATVAAGAELRLPWRRDYNALVYVAAGFGLVGDESRPVHTGQTSVFGDGDTIVIRAADSQESRSPALELFILGGAAIKEPVAWMGPFWDVESANSWERNSQTFPQRGLECMPGCALRRCADYAHHTLKQKWATRLIKGADSGWRFCLDRFQAVSQELYQSPSSYLHRVLHLRLLHFL